MSRSLSPPNHAREHGRSATLRPRSSVVGRNASRHEALRVPASGTTEIYEDGGTISATKRRALVKRHGYAARTVGNLYGRRAPHLNLDATTGASRLTSRGFEVARQYLFVARRARAGLRHVPPSCAMLQHASGTSCRIGFARGVGRRLNASFDVGCSLVCGAAVR